MCTLIKFTLVYIFKELLKISHPLFEMHLRQCIWPLLSKEMQLLTLLKKPRLIILFSVKLQLDLETLSILTIFQKENLDLILNNSCSKIFAMRRAIYYIEIKEKLKQNPLLLMREMKTILTIINTRIVI